MSMRGLMLGLIVLSASCGEAPPPPAKSEGPRMVRVHVSNASRFDICRVEACGNEARLVSAQGAAAPATPLKPHGADLYEVKKCSGTLKAVACPTPENPNPCLKAEGGTVDDGTMFRVITCSL